MRALTKIVFGALLLLPGVTAAQAPAAPAEVLHPSQYGEAKPAKFPSTNKPNAHTGDHTIVPINVSEKHPRLEAAHNRHINAPDGIPNPIGCGTFYTDFKFVFGSCRQFFGTGNATPGTVFTPYNKERRQPAP